MRIKRVWSDCPEVNSRFKELDRRIDKKLKTLPPVDELFEADELHVYTTKMLAFLEEYKKDLNVARALKTLDISQVSYRKWLDTKPHFVGAMNKINEAYIDAVLMDTKTIAGWSVEILKDLHSRYKEGDSKSANALATMAGHMLKASGNFKESDGGSKGTQVLIQINTGSKTISPKESSPKVIEADSNINLNIKSNESKKSISGLSLLC